MYNGTLQEARIFGGDGALTFKANGKKHSYILLKHATEISNPKLDQSNNILVEAFLFI